MPMTATPLATWDDCARILHADNYRHTAGNSYARLTDKRGKLDKARINKDAEGNHTIEYL
jgi:hypothetical protein